MGDFSLLISFVAGGIISGGAVWLLLRSLFSSRLSQQQSSHQMELEIRDSRIRELEAALKDARDELGARGEALQKKGEEVAELRAEVGRLEERLKGEQALSREKLDLLERAQDELSKAFKALSGEALQQNNRLFLDLALQTLASFKKEAQGDLRQRQKAIEELARPIRESLEKVDMRLSELEKARIGAYRMIEEQIRSLVEHHLPTLHKETESLVKALRQPHVRGRWGEIQLKRVVEMAGMLAHCDFVEQQSLNSQGGRLRPDLIVNLPGGRKIVIDAKTPLSSYLDAMECQPEQASRKMQDHVTNFKRHIDQLASKGYWESVRKEIGQSPDFVIMFIPGESFFSAALRAEPSLLEYGVERGVVLATPTTLISVLKAVAYAWQQEALAENAEQIAKLGRDLYERIYTLSRHWAGVGKGLKQAVEAFNKATGTLESRVFVGARRFVELKAAPEGKELSPVQPLEVVPRELTRLAESDGDEE